ncbi:DUF2975 domain-containing protein [Cognatishimia activa]|uniref:DUF2975 domain-containing protein n=1 Tax=Cognatishimia activa TaxID=1715691 RepID=A0A975ERP4_9RHOB|nr:DUF2975 domain-containing protein [Cognatishimia activa]QTN36904.1 DUF2975 domain-containing protein [Cognatishimia activa]
MFESKSLARLLKWACTTVLVALPLLILAYVFFERPTPANASDIYTDVMILSAPPTWAFMLANAFSLGSLVVLLAMVLNMRRLFDHYSQGRVLTFESAKLLQRIGRFLLAVALLRLVSYPVLSVLLTLGNPEGQRQLSMALTEGDIGFLIAAGFVFLVGTAMHEAAQNAEDIKGFV